MKDSNRKRVSCTVKKVHYNFLTAMQHCISLQKKEPFAQILIYKCDFCEGMHITRGAHRLHSARKVLTKNLRLMKDPLWWEFCPQSIQSHRIELEIKAILQLYGEGTQ